jgi:hypothetical protein
LPHLWPTCSSSGSPPLITARYFSSNPSDSRSLRTPCPPPTCAAGRQGITPAFGYSAPHPSAEGTLTLLIHALPSAHYGPVRLPPRPPLLAASRPLPSPATGLPRLLASPFQRAVPITPADRTGAPVITSPCTRPSPHFGRVGIGIMDFEACSGFTCVTARWIARPPEAAFVTRLRPVRLPVQAAHQLPDQSTTFWAEPSSAGDTRLRGAPKRTQFSRQQNAARSHNGLHSEVILPQDRRQPVLADSRHGNDAFYSMVCRPKTSSANRIWPAWRQRVASYRLRRSSA